MGPSVHEIGVCGRRICPQLPISCGRVFLKFVRKCKCPGQWFSERRGEKTPASIVPDFVHKGAISGTRRSQFVHSPPKTNTAALDEGCAGGGNRAESSAAPGRSRFVADGGLERKRRTGWSARGGRAEAAAWLGSCDGGDGAFAYTGSHTRTRQQWMCSPPRGVWSMLA